MSSILDMSVMVLESNPMISKWNARRAAPPDKPPHLKRILVTFLHRTPTRHLLHLLT